MWYFYFLLFPHDLQLNNNNKFQTWLSKWSWGEASYRLILWMIIGASIAYYAYSDLTLKQITAKGGIISESRIKSWNDLGLIGLNISMVCILFYLIQSRLEHTKSNKNVKIIKDFFRKVSSDILLPIYCVGSSIIGAFMYLAVKFSENYSDVLKAFSFTIYFLLIIGFVFLIHTALQKNWIVEFSDFCKKVPIIVSIPVSIFLILYINYVSWYTV